MSSPHKIKPVGIDLGTTFSALAYLDASGRPVTLPNSEGDLITPSVLFVDGDEVIVGKEALKAGQLEPEKLVAFMKREMGSPFYSRLVCGEQYPPEVLQSQVLQKLKVDAELRLGPVEHAVITVPAFFDEPRRKGTQDAGKIAGLEVLNIINEPTAAAIAYGVQSGFLDAQGQSRKPETILIYDLGGGTFDVTVMKIDGSSYTAVATDGDVYLGGIDWDGRLADHVAQAYLTKHGGTDPRDDLGALQRLLREAEDVKRALTAREQTTFAFEHNGKAIRVPITRGQFEDLTADLVDRTRFTTQSVLSDAGLKWDQISRLLLVGGSSRMPMVQQMLEEEFGRAPDRSLSADEAIAHGAAIYAGLLLATRRGEAPQLAVKNVNSHSLGVLGIEKATGRPINSILIERNTPLPVTKVSRFQTAKTDQRRVVANIIEGGDSQGTNATPIGKCVIQDLPPKLPAGTPVDVAFTYSDDGRLTVRAKLPTLGKTAELNIERSSGLSDGQLQGWAKQKIGTAPKQPLNLEEH